MFINNLKYHLLDFCNGELTEQKKFKTAKKLKEFLDNNYVDDPIIIYGIDKTKKFIKGEDIIH